MKYDKAIVNINPFLIQQDIYLFNKDNQEEKKMCKIKELPKFLSSFDLSEIEFIGDKALGRKIVEECKTLYDKTNVIYIFNE